MFHLGRRSVLSLVAALGAAALLPTMAFAQAPAARKPFRVVTKFTVIQDIAQNVAGTAAVVESMAWFKEGLHAQPG